MLFEGINEDVVRLAARAFSVVDSIKRIRTPELNFCAEKTTTKHQQWCPPGKGWVKINVDAAMDKENMLVGLGVVIRNSRGKVTTAAIKTEKNDGNVERAEASAAMWGLHVPFKAGAVSVDLKSDLKGVIELINNKMGTLTKTFWVIFDILETKKSFQNFKAQHVPRSCNIVVHSMAKLCVYSLLDPIRFKYNSDQI